MGNCYVYARFREVAVVSCYLTPSDDISTFQNKLDAIEDLLVDRRQPFIVAGDLNARAVDWGMSSTNSRGRKIMDMAARSGLVVANRGSRPTFHRPGCEGTIPDVTFGSEHIVDRIKDWKILDDFTGSDHEYISYDFQNTSQQNHPSYSRKTSHRWDISKVDTGKLLAELDRQERQFDGTLTSKQVGERSLTAMERACNVSMPKTHSKHGGRRQAYWWNHDIAEKRKVCIQCRRRLTRARRSENFTTEALAAKIARKELSIAITRSKHDKWKELCKDINKDPWGLGYKIVMKKLRNYGAVPNVDDDTMDHIVATLFPAHIHEAHERAPVELDGSVPDFTEEELNIAALSLKNKKAPGPDNIPAEILKVIASGRPTFLLRMYNACLKERIFPEAWKEQTGAH
ncbi:uncharacterized protein Dmoj_GI25793 [Drosophila mojavensis]|uniref:Endonuclease/exonuclease/phosphatase domain-containing protein n=1 Tax=Drosophila mojavensis TaxID=7230 RepID=A0A0Q9XVK4_DROMO|nr:uncharacterized protein Dmoj_GI25793 [Drosophila mojavensis]